MKAIICEDQKVFSDQIAEYVKEWAAEKNVECRVFAYETAEEFLNNCDEGEDYDVIFLDIKMGHLSGMDLAKTIRKTNQDIPIVFVTSMREYMEEGYEVDAMRFLGKPIKKEKIYGCLDKISQTERLKRYFLIKDGETSRRIAHEDIIYIEKYAHNAEVVTTKNKYSIRKTMEQLQKELNDDLFVKCHKSYIINIRRVEHVINVSALMSNGDNVPFGKNMAKKINDKFHKYNVNRVR
jgi:DNA-binding LytR/AlgR family response regulator